METLPGTTLPFSPLAETDAFQSLGPLFAVSPGGLSLSQVTGMTGLSASTVQNWVKRGWVSNPVGKKYGEMQVARILLINLLRPAMRLEDIVRLLGYLNGRVDDRSDDTIPEPRLYSLVCRALLRLEQSRTLSESKIRALADTCLRDLPGLPPESTRRLSNVLTILLLNVAASRLMLHAEELFARLDEKTAAAEPPRA